MSRYEVDKFDPPPDPDLICCICHSVLDTPRISPCNHVFCKLCIETWLKRQDTCPTCRDTTLDFDLRPVIPMVQNVLNRLNMICDYRINGCDKKVMLEHYLNHIENCDYQMLKCRFAKCERSFLRKECKTHEEECRYREIKCNKDCGLMILFEDKSSHDCLTSLKKTIDEKNALIDTLNQKVEQLQSQSEDLNRQLCEMNENFANSWNSSSLDSWEIGTDITEFSMDDFSDSLSDTSLTEGGSDTQHRRGVEGISQRTHPNADERARSRTEPEVSDHEGLGDGRGNGLLHDFMNRLNDRRRNRRPSSSTDGDGADPHEDRANAEGQTTGNVAQVDGATRNHNYNLRLNRQVILQQSVEAVERAFEDQFVSNTLNRNSVLPPDNSQTRAAATVTWLEEHVPLANSTLNSDLLENENCRTSPGRNESIIPNTSYISDDSSTGRQEETTATRIIHQSSNSVPTVNDSSGVVENSDEISCHPARIRPLVEVDSDVENNFSCDIIENNTDNTCSIGNSTDSSDISVNTLNGSVSETPHSQNHLETNSAGDHSENRLSHSTCSWTSEELFSDSKILPSSLTKNSTLSSKVSCGTSGSDHIILSSSDSQSEDTSPGSQVIDYRTSRDTSAALISDSEGLSSPSVGESLPESTFSYRSRESRLLKSSFHPGRTVKCSPLSEADSYSYRDRKTSSNLSMSGNGVSNSNSTSSFSESREDTEASNSNNDSHSEISFKDNRTSDVDSVNSNQSVDSTTTYINDSAFRRSLSKSDIDTDDSSPDMLSPDWSNSSQSESTVKGSPSNMSSATSVNGIPSENEGSIPSKNGCDSHNKGDSESAYTTRIARIATFSPSKTSSECMNQNDTPSCQSYLDENGLSSSTEQTNPSSSIIDLCLFKHLYPDDRSQQKSRCRDRSSFDSSMRDSLPVNDHSGDNQTCTRSSYFSGKSSSMSDVNRHHITLHDYKKGRGKTFVGNSLTADRSTQVELSNLLKKVDSPKVTRSRRTSRPPMNNIADASAGEDKYEILGLRSKGRGLSAACLNSLGNSMNQQHIESSHENLADPPNFNTAPISLNGNRNVVVCLQNKEGSCDKMMNVLKKNNNLGAERRIVPLNCKIKTLDQEENSKSEQVVVKPMALMHLVSVTSSCTSNVTSTTTTTTTSQLLVPSNLSVNLTKPSLIGQKRPSQADSDIPAKQPCLGIPLFPHPTAQQTLKVKIDLSLVSYPPPPNIPVSQLTVLPGSSLNSHLVQTPTTLTVGMQNNSFTSTKYNSQNTAPMTTTDTRNHSTGYSGNQAVLNGQPTQPVLAPSYIYSSRGLIAGAQVGQTLDTLNGSSNSPASTNTSTNQWLIGNNSLACQQRQKSDTGARIITIPEAVQNAPKTSNLLENKVNSKSSHANGLSNCSRKNSSRRENRDNSGRHPCSAVAIGKNEGCAKKQIIDAGNSILGNSASQNSRNLANHSENNYGELVRSQGGNSNILLKNILSSVGGRLDLFASESDDSDSSWSPEGTLEETDESFTEESDSDSSYEVQVPKSVLQLLDEYVSDESDHSWTVDN